MMQTETGHLSVFRLFFMWIDHSEKVRSLTGLVLM